MTTSTTPPLLTPLPPAPLPTDAEAVFDAKAGASLTAQAVMVGEVNTALAWQADSMTATAGSMTAAASSAAAAAASATAAAGSVVSAQAQVGLAATQAGNAAASANSAQVAAAAAGSAVGLPSVAGHGGQALVVKKDESGFELKALDQAIGDVLITTRTPDATYLLPDTVYSKSAYPELSSILGVIGVNSDGASFVAVNNGQLASNTYCQIVCGKDDVMIAVGYVSGASSSSTGGTAIRSVDNGITWSQLPGLTGVYSLYNVVTDGKGVWLATTGIARLGYRSVDNGLTWSVVSFTGVSVVRSIVTDKNGVWLVSSADYSETTYARSLDNGVTWSSISNAGVAGEVSTDGWGTWYTTSNSALCRSVNNGVSWQVMVYNNVSGVQVPVCGGDVSVFYSDYKNFISSDRGLTWRVFPVTTSGRIAVYVDREGVIYSQQYGRIYKSYDYGESWSTSILSVPLRYDLMAVNSFGVWVATTAAASPLFYRSVRLFNYDSSTQFKTPSYPSLKGYNSFIKGKLQ